MKLLKKDVNKNKLVVERGYITGMENGQFKVYQILSEANDYYIVSDRSY
jgi:hypothetical protein